LLLFIPIFLLIATFLNKRDFLLFDYSDLWRPIPLSIALPLPINCFFEVNHLKSCFIDLQFLIICLLIECTLRISNDLLNLVGVQSVTFSPEVGSINTSRQDAALGQAVYQARDGVAFLAYRAEAMSLCPRTQELL
jgi:hypothetical protein